MTPSCRIKMSEWAAQLCEEQGLPVRAFFAEADAEVSSDERVRSAGKARRSRDRAEGAGFRALVQAYELSLHQGAGGGRKRMGMYYTPACLIESLLDSALEPCLAACHEHAQAESAAEALLGLRILDPSCGSGDFLLAAARRVVRCLVALGVMSPAQAWREVVSRCVYGVDQDPIAVELARLNLYLASAEVGVPIEPSEHLRCGNALLGCLSRTEVLGGIPMEAFDKLPGDDADVLRRLRKLNAVGCRHADGASEYRPAAMALISPQQWSDAADLVTAAYLLPKRDGYAVPLTQHVHACLRGDCAANGAELQTARAICRRERVLHWFDAFPDVLAEGKPTFDCILGNPPWEKLEVNEREWFRGRCATVAQARGVTRKEEIHALRREKTDLWRAFEEEKHRSAALSHYLHRYALRNQPGVGNGIINLYVPFLCQCMRMCSDAGRLGMVVPTGLMSDLSTQPLFAALHARGYLCSFYDFENRARLFPDVDLRQRFACVTLGSPAGQTARFAFFLKHPEELAQPGRQMDLPASFFELLNPHTRGGVSLRCAADAWLAERIHRRVPLLGDAWQVELRQGLFNMTSDSHLFVRRSSVSSRVAADMLPLYEGKMFYLHEPRFAAYCSGGEVRESSPRQLAQPAFMPSPRYVVRRADVLSRLPSDAVERGWLLGFRMVSSPTNERSFICSFLPLAGVGNSVGLIWSRAANPELQLCLAANLSSLVFDYVVRLKLSGLNLNFHIVRQLPVLPPEAYDETARRYIRERLLPLVYTGSGLNLLSQACGGPTKPYRYADGETRARLRAELDAWFARAYGLTREEFAYILDPQLAPQLRGNCPGAATFSLLRSHELRAYGEYRTARLCLKAYDEVAAAEK